MHFGNGFIRPDNSTSVAGMTRTNRPIENEWKQHAHTTRSAAHLQFHAFIEMLIRARNDTTTNQSLHGQRVMWWRINANGAFARTRETFHVPFSSHLRRNKVIYKWCLTLESWTLQLNAKTEWGDEKKNWFSASQDIFMINDKSSTCVRINDDGRHPKSNDFYSMFGLVLLSFWLNDNLPRSRIDSNLTKLWNHQVSQSDEKCRLSQSHSKACPTGQIPNKPFRRKKMGFAFVKFEQKNGRI